MLKIQNFFSNTILITLQTLLFWFMMMVEPVLLSAGPPYFTDDPEPVDYQHLEFYLASQSQFTKDSKDITLPHFEVNYGVIPNVQLHLIAPFRYTKQEGSLKHYGYSDTELGIKWRFIQESEYIPMIGIFPMAEIPTGNKDKGLGNGKAQYFFPLWIQKSRGNWSSYGGGGYWINSGEGNKNYWIIGWQAQYKFTDALSVGAEIFHRSASETGGESGTGFNIGAVIDFGELHHLLLSAGRDFKGPDTFTSYIAYQLTIGIGGKE